MAVICSVSLLTVDEWLHPKGEGRVVFLEVHDVESVGVPLFNVSN
jgi:hypothetical protein